jgi:hypothetical protein
MTPSKSFSRPVLRWLHDNRMMGIRAGMDSHRFVGIWVVVVRDRAFVRSWNDKPEGWFRVFLEEPRGAIMVGEREVRIRSKKVRGERLLEEIDLAYAEKYNTPGSRKYVTGLAEDWRRATTLELVPR